nr:hypothetical protein BN444_01772 [Xanthomonas translucens pv. translucens DSM 18974]
MLSAQEAARRINVQQAAQQQVAEQVEKYRDRLAGAYWQDEPELRFVIRLKGNASVPLPLLHWPLLQILEQTNDVSAHSSRHQIDDLFGSCVDRRTRVQQREILALQP